MVPFSNTVVSAKKYSPILFSIVTKSLQILKQ